MITLILGHKGSGKTKRLMDMCNEAVVQSKGNVIFIEKDTPLSREEIEDKLQTLKNAFSCDGSCPDSNDAVREAMAAAVPTYMSSEEVNKTASESKEMKLAMADR